MVMVEAWICIGLHGEGVLVGVCVVGSRVLVDEVVVGSLELFWVVVLVRRYWLKVWSMVVVTQRML